MAIPSLADQRKAIGKSISSGFDGGKSAAEARRAIGSRIEAERRGESVVEDLNRLITPARQRRTLRTVQPVGALPVTRGRGNYTPPPASSSGGGIASPLTEQDYALREFHAPKYLSTSDGLITFEIRPVSKIVMTDANDIAHAFNYASPP